jgi:hypothetical protein
MSKMTIEEFKKKKINSISPVFKLFYFLYISDIQVTDKKVWNNNNDFGYRTREVNPYNPLSYILLLFLLPIAFMINGVNRETFIDIKKLFIYR